MKTLIMIFTIFSLIPTAEAMNIKGKVLDPNGNPIGGALVRIQQTNDAQTTNIMGNFNFGFKLKKPELLQEPIVIVIVNSLGFSEIRITMDYKEDEFFDLGKIYLSYLKSEDELLTPLEFSRLKNEELLSFLDSIFSVELFSYSELSTRDIESYQDEISDLPAFENISKKEFRILKQNIEQIVSRLSLKELSHASVSLLIQDQDNRIIYGYEVFTESETKECHLIYSNNFVLLLEKCEKNEDTSPDLDPLDLEE